LLAVVALLLGILGRFLGTVFGQALDQQIPLLIGNLSWEYSPAVAGLLMGLAIGGAIFLFRWLRNDPNSLHSLYRSSMQSYTLRYEQWWARLIQLGHPWWINIGFLLVSLVAAARILEFLQSIAAIKGL